MSIEALAMAGMNYTECGINLDLQPPLYLVAEEDNLSFRDNKKEADINSIKERIWEWAKAVASINSTDISDSKSEICEDATVPEIVTRKEAFKASTKLNYILLFEPHKRVLEKLEIESTRV